MIDPELIVLYEDNHLLVINKSAGVVSQGARPGDRNVSDLAKQYIKRKYNKPGNVYLGIVSRLDAPVTGVMVLARTSKAAARLTDRFSQRAVEKKYLAIVEGQLDKSSGKLKDWLEKDEARRRMIVGKSKSAREAELAYQVIGESSDRSLVEIDLLTGRKHQIRVQFSAREHPILGDGKYGSRRSFSRGIALHARELSVKHPTKDEEMRFVADVPSSWRNQGFDQQLFGA